MTPFRTFSRSVRASRRRFVGGTLAVAASLPALGRVGLAQDKEVNVYNWDTYIGETTLSDFTDATGIAIRYDLYGGNEELFAKLREGNPGYDVIFPSNNWLSRMAAADMIVPLDHDKIPNADNIDPAFQNVAFDPGRKFSMPYFWGTVGLGYRTSAGPRPDSWRAVFEPTDYAGMISLLNAQDTIQAALRYLGYSANTTDPALIDEAVELLIAAKPAIKTFTPDTGQDLLIAGDVNICMEYNGDIVQVMAEDDDLGYVLPAEGSILWEDAMCIPKGAPNVDSAHAFINFILDAEVHAAIAEYVEYACPNAAAKKLLPAETLSNPAIYPAEADIARLEAAKYLGEEGEQRLVAAMDRVLAA